MDVEGPSETDSGVFGLRTSPEMASVVLIPVPFDATTSYHRGAAQGPAAILQASCSSRGNCALDGCT